MIIILRSGKTTSFSRLLHIFKASYIEDSLTSPKEAKSKKHLDSKDIIVTDNFNETIKFHYSEDVEKEQ